MTDPHEKLQSTVDELHDELARLEALDPDMRAKLEGAVADIRKVLSGADESEPPDQESIIERLNESVQHFDVAHPTLSRIIGRVADALSGIGI